MSRVAPPGRVLALDLGARRIGVAVCDPEGLIASPYATIERSGEGREADHRAVARLVDEVGAVRVVVGLPLSMDGSRGPAAEAASQEAADLRKALDVPVEELDERLSTVGAFRRLSAAGLDSRKQRRGGKIDQEAAAVILESWLEARRNKS